MKIRHFVQGQSNGYDKTFKNVKNQLCEQQAYLIPIVVWFFSVPPEECWDNTLKLRDDCFLQNPFQFIINF
jgi:hypothetical protein